MFGVIVTYKDGTTNIHYYKTKERLLEFIAKFGCSFDPEQLTYFVTYSQDEIEQLFQLFFFYLFIDCVGFVKTKNTPCTQTPKE